MKMLRFMQGAYRWALMVAAGGSLYLLSDCDEEVRTSVLTGTTSAITALIDGILNAVVDAITNQSTA